MRYKYLRKAKRWYDTKKHRIVSRSSVPENETFYYNQSLKRYYDIESGRIISKEEALKRLYQSGRSKIYRKSKTGTIYKDNQIVKSLKKEMVIDKKPEIKQYKYTSIETYTKDVSQYFHKYLDNLFIIDKKALVSFLWDFYNLSKKDEMNRYRLYVYLKVRQQKKEGEYLQEMGSLQLTEDTISKEKIDAMLDNMLESWIKYYQRSQTYGAHIVSIQATAIFKQWKIY